MSYEVSKSFVHQFRDSFIFLSQQKGSRLRDYVRTNSGVIGKSDNWERIGSTVAQQIVSRHAQTPIISIPHSRRRCSLKDWNHADLIDNVDKIKMLADPQNPYMLASLWSIGRAMDDEIISAMLGNSVSVDAADATSNVALGSSQKVVHGSAGLTLAKLLSAKEILDGADVDPDMMRCIALTSKQVSDLLNTTQVTSSDYASVKALAEGKLDSFLGFKFIRTERLTNDSDGNRQVICWISDGVGLSIGEDIKTEISTRSDRNYSVQVYVEASFGACRVIDEHVVEVACVES